MASRVWFSGQDTENKLRDIMINIKIFVDYSFGGWGAKRRCVVARNSRSFKVVI